MRDPTYDAKRASDGDGPSNQQPDARAHAKPLKHVHAFEEEIRQPDVEPFPFILPEQITLLPKDYLIDGFLGAGETSAFYGPPDAGKSAVVLDIACHVATGLRYCGRRTTQGAVLYFAIERGAVVERRLLAWCQHHNAAGVPIAIVTEMVDLRNGAHDTQRAVATIKALAKACGRPVVLVVIDTLNRALAGGDENSGKDMAQIINAADRIKRATGAHVAFIHHVPVDRTDRLRGHGSVNANLDLTVRTTKQDEHSVLVETDKANDLVDKPTFAFRFEAVELLPATETHSTTTAPVLVPIHSAATLPKPKTSKKLPRAAQTALRTLSEAVLDQGTPPPSTQIPANVKVVSLDVWRQQCYRRGISTSDKSDFKRKAFDRASSDLISMQKVGILDDFVWLPTSGT